MPVAARKSGRGVNQQAAERSRAARREPLEIVRRGVSIEPSGASPKDSAQPAPPPARYYEAVHHRSAAYLESVDRMIQRALSDDLADGSTKTAIAGETHDEIPARQERRNWSRLGIRVMYEAATLPGRGKRPDPPILRLAYAWKSIEGLKSFWELVDQGEDVSQGGVEVLEEIRTLAGFMRDELDDIGPVDLKVFQAVALLDQFEQGLPADEDALMSKSLMARQYLAQSKMGIMSQLDRVIGGIHRAGSFADVTYDLEDLRIERSREMLKNIDSAKPPKTIYKVGDDHVGDMKRGKWKHDPSVAVLSKAEYVSEYEDIDVEPSSGGRAVFNSVTNDML